MSFATLNTAPVSRARTTIPKWGAWWCDVALVGEVTLSGSVTLKLSDLSLVGTVVSGGVAQGSSRYRIAAGAAGWGSTIAKKAYSNDAGVKLLTVLRDAAEACGETLDETTVDSSTRVGPHFTREEGPAGRVLELLAPRAWYVGEDGITRLGARTGAELTVEAARVQVDLAAGSVELAADLVATILPGALVDGLEVVDVEHELDGHKLRTRVWGPGRSGTSRRLAALQSLLEQLLPALRYRGTYEYRVVTQETERLNLQPVRSSLGLPDLRRVRVRPGVPGCRADHALGSTVLVTFVNADPGRPVVVAGEDAEGSGFMPTLLELGADGPTLGVARITDTVQAGPFAGVITSGSARVKAGL